MSDQIKQSRLNRTSYLLNSLFFVPVISFGRALGNANTDSEFTSGMITVAQLFTLILLIPYIGFTIKRLHDANRSGWFSFALIPPFTIFLWVYLLIAGDKDTNKWGKPSSELVIFGLRVRGWRIAIITLIAIFLAYLVVLFATFLFDSGTY